MDRGQRDRVQREDGGLCKSPQRIRVSVTVTEYFFLSNPPIPLLSYLPITFISSLYHAVVSAPQSLNSV